MVHDAALGCQWGVLQGFEFDAYGNRYAFDSAGASIATSAIDGAGIYGYTGRRWDAGTGFYYFRNRYLNVGLGRFLTMDPMGRWGDPQGFGNPFAAFGNLGNGSVDPLGWRCSGEGGGEPDGPKKRRVVPSEITIVLHGGVIGGSGHDLVIDPERIVHVQIGGGAQKKKKLNWFEKAKADWGELQSMNAVANEEVGNLIIKWFNAEPCRKEVAKAFASCMAFAMVQCRLAGGGYLHCMGGALLACSALASVDCHLCKFWW